MDVARGIGIILVVFGHLQRGMLDLGLTTHVDVMRIADFVLYTAHMPLFFLLAGRNTHASLRRQGRRTFLSERVLTVVWPYLIWSALFVVVQNAATLGLKVHHVVPLSDLPWIAIYPIGIFWFLQSLFLAQVGAAMAFRHAASFLVVTLAVDFLVSAGSAPLIPCLSLTLWHLPFFALGFLTAERNIRLPAWARDRFYVLPVACGWLGLALIALSLHVAVPVEFCTLPISCLGIALLLIVSKAWVRGSVATVLGSIGRKSMPIYVLHIFTLPLFVRAARSAPADLDLIVLLIGTAFGIGVSLVIFRALEAMGIARILGLTGRLSWSSLLMMRRDVRHQPSIRQRRELRAGQHLSDRDRIWEAGR